MAACKVTTEDGGTIVSEFSVIFDGEQKYFVQHIQMDDNAWLCEP